MPICHEEVSDGAPPDLRAAAQFGHGTEASGGSEQQSDDEAGKEAVKEEDGDEADWERQEEALVWHLGSVGKLAFDPAYYTVEEANRVDIAAVTLSQHDDRYRHGDSDQLPVLTLEGLNTKVIIFHGHPALLPCPDTAISTVLSEKPAEDGALRRYIFAHTHTKLQKRSRPKSLRC